MGTEVKRHNQRMQQAAYALAASRHMACKGDIDLLIEIVEGREPELVVVQLGAGSGTMALAVLGVNPFAQFWSIDNNGDNLDWEAAALGNASYDYLDRHGVLADSTKAGVLYDGLPIDLLIVDANHTYEAVVADLKAWLPHVKVDGIIFLHDYDGKTAPRQYEGVKRAADETFNRPPWKKGGWSAAFRKGSDD